jgi:hypothetical protein
MSLFQEAQCLRCGGALPLRVLWDFARVNDAHVFAGLELLTRSGLLIGKIGVVCPNCGAAFRVIQTRIYTFRAVVWAAFLGGAWYVGAWARRANLAVPQWLEVLVPLVGVCAIYLLQRIYTPRLASVREPIAGEKLIFPLRSAYEGSKL